MDYYKIFNFNKEPFSNSPDPDFFFKSHKHVECLQKLEIALRLKRGLNIVIGDVGTGKTTLCRHLIKNFKDDENINTYLILDPSYQNQLDFLVSIFQMFQPQDDIKEKDPFQIKEKIKNYLFQKGVNENQTTILIIDEGQKIPVYCLEILREFLNYETNEYKLLQIVIFSQPEFEKQVDKIDNFADRINMYHVLRPLSFKETRLMIQYRIEKACNKTNNYPKAGCFSFFALWEIYRSTKGYPRKIVNLCHQVLLSMIIQNKVKAGRKLVNACSGRNFVKSPMKVNAFIIVCLILCMSVALVFSFKENNKNFKRENIITADEKVDSNVVHKVIVNKSVQEKQKPLKKIDTTQINQSDDILSLKDIKILGKLRIGKDETLANIIRSLYGQYKIIYVDQIMKSNPNIDNYDFIQAGQKIAFPVVFSKKLVLSKHYYWIEIAKYKQLEYSFNFLRGLKKRDFRIIPFWNQKSGLTFSIIFKNCFADKDSALNQFKILSSSFHYPVIISDWDKDTVFFSDPYLNNN